MDQRELSRRSVLQGGAALAGMAFLGSRLPALASEIQASTPGGRWPAQVALGFPTRPGEEVLPWIDQPDPNPVPDIVGNLLVWEELDSWITPNAEFFTVKHYAEPSVDPQTWRLEVHGLVQRPMTLSLADLRARPHQDVAFTIECSGNHGPPFTGGLIGNAIWTGTSLSALLQEAGVLADGSEVVFWGTETGPEDIGGIQVVEQFARSMSLEEAMDPRNILCWGMNGEDLPPEHGAPVRLIVPGWYGVANVKWLQRIEILDRPCEGRFMAREYRTIRNEERNGQTLARITSVGLTNIKSVPAKVTRLDDDYRIIAVSWGAPIARVEVRIDDGAWVEATLEHGGDPDTWAIWSLDWGRPPDGEHRITTRAIDTDGNIQPAADDLWITNKLTYWESNGQVTRRVNVGARHFPETGHTLSGRFLTFWGQHGGLATFGYPLTEEFEEDGRAVQYFERQRFELHPENVAPYDVLLGLLGAEALGSAPHPPTEPDDGSACDYHAATGHNACGRFRDVWQAGGLMIYGYPITEEFEEVGLTVQYFERARFEHHPGNAQPYDVLLGLLGYEALEARYGGNLPPGAV